MALSSEIQRQLLEDFGVECREHLAVMEQDLLSLQGALSAPPEAETLHRLFRAAHTIKGGAGFLALPNVGAFTHTLESILKQVVERVRPLEPSLISTLFAAVDELGCAFGDMSKCAHHDFQALHQRLLELEQSPVPQAQSSLERDGFELFEEQPEEVMSPSPNREEKWLPEYDAFFASSPESESESRTVLEPSTATGAIPTLRGNSAKGRQDIRVDLEKLDLLVNLVGELVIAQQMVMRNPMIQQLQDEHLDRSIHHLQRVSADLQDIAMAVRMVPLSSTCRKMSRLVHEVSKQAGKQVQLTVLGEETEVDKTVIELINDPLIHILRNAIDHGIEHSEQRLAANKPAVGNITIEAKHQGGEVLIVITDDGRGLDREAILRKAIERGLCAPDARPSDQEVFAFIFEPGFSTAQAITDLSGRGVGMDVVRRNLEKVRGRIDLRSTPGVGTTVILRIPLTLAIIDGMLIRVGSARYTIPLLSIRESFRPSAEDVHTTPDGTETVRIRDEVLPVLRLHRIFDKEPDSTAFEEGILTIVEADGTSACFFVDEILGQQQTVIKALSGYLGDIRGLSGCSILGDGSVSLILDVPGLLKTHLEPSFQATIQPATGEIT